MEESDVDRAPVANDGTTGESAEIDAAGSEERDWFFSDVELLGDPEF
ncbi:MAG TPA: hypothetical protein VKE69_08410 [Planctomycetota bacterium]|nr:hypothetical protein [Planctomycetota bacterium]